MGNTVVLIIKKPFLPAANISGFYLENGVRKNGGRLPQQGILPWGPFLEFVQKMKEFVFELFIRKEKGRGPAFTGGNFA